MFNWRVIKSRKSCYWNLINELSFTSPLEAEEYITIDNEGISNSSEMITDK